MVHLNLPIPGHYTMRLVKKGPLVPVEIRDVSDRCPETGELMEDQRFVATINGEEAPVERAWPWCSKAPITEAEYRFMVADARHAEAYRPEDPKASPRRAVDLLNAPIPF